MKVIWFKANSRGNGWKPATWQGWIIWCICIGLDIAAVIFFTPLVLERWTMLLVFLLVFLVINSAFVWICFKTGEPVQWQKPKP